MQSPLPSGNVKVFAALTLFASILLLFISPDSYTHDVFERVDSACFFTGGKAWMNGMVPYVDFTDSKGPLLWLIYGIGYLLSHYNYIGVFWISCLWYGCTFYLTYLTFGIFLSDKRQCLLGTAVMCLAFFMPVMHYEVRAEDFCQPFIMLSLYHTARMLYGKERYQTAKAVNSSFFALGLSFAALVLIKFSIAAMQSAFILYAFYHLIRSKRSIIIPFCTSAAGAFALCLPFLVYFLITGSLTAFIQEYFLNTLQTVSPQQSFLGAYYDECMDAWTNYPVVFVMLTLLIVGCVAIMPRLGKYRLFPLLTTLFFFALAMKHHGLVHYFSAVAFGLTFLVAAMLQWLRPKVSRTSLAISFLCLMVLCTFGAQIKRTEFHVYFWENDVRRKVYYDMACLISQVEKAGVFNAWGCGNGIETLPDALPGSKHWIYQLGSTEEMHEAHVEELRSRQPDFVFLRSEESILRLGMTLQSLDSIGYHCCYDWATRGVRHYLYTKHDVQLPAQSVTPSDWDILLKRKPFSGR